MHPLLMPTYLFGLLLFVYPEYYRPLNSEQVTYIILRLSIVTLFLPALSISILKFTGYIGSVHLEKRSERLMPYLFTSLYYGVLIYIFYQGMSFRPFLILMLSMGSLILVLALFNFRIKVSAHAASLTGVLGILWGIKLNDPELSMLYPVVAVIMTIGIVMSARLQLNAHRPLEIYLGAILGFIVCFCGVFFFI